MKSSSFETDKIRSNIQGIYGYLEMLEVNSRDERKGKAVHAQSYPMANGNTRKYNVPLSFLSPSIIFITPTIHEITSFS